MILKKLLISKTASLPSEPAGGDFENLQPDIMIPIYLLSRRSAALAALDTSHRARPNPFARILYALIAFSLMALSAGSLSAATMSGMGKRSNGQLGDFPTLVAASGIQGGAVNSDSAFFIKDDGSLWAMGKNSDGQLGDGTNTDRKTPVQIATGVASVSVGYFHTLFVKTDGSLWATGNNRCGQLGDGTTTYRSTPVQIATGVASVSMGPEHTLFVKTDGSLWAMGANPTGALGDGTGINRNRPVQIATGVASVSAGRYHTLFVKTDGSLWATGSNDYGQLGDGTGINRNRPVQIATGVASVSAGEAHTLFVKTDGSLWGMGHNEGGELGNGTWTNCSTPVQIATRVATVAAGCGAHTLFIKTDGSLWAMGYNNNGQLGDGTATNRNTPVQVANNATKLFAGGNQSLFMKSDKSIWAVCPNWFGPCAVEHLSMSNRLAPGPLADDVIVIAADEYHSHFLKADGSLWAMGDNDKGQLGDGTNTDHNRPVQIATGVASVSAGTKHTVFVKTDGSLWAMGHNGYGQLGDGTTAHRSAPVQITTGVASASAGGYKTLFVRTDGSLWAMGDNDNGQLGDGTNTRRWTPVQIATGVTSVSAGAGHTAFVKTDGSLWAMGYNWAGQLGDGTETDRWTPVQIATGVASVSAGAEHTAFVKTDGSLWAMGHNGYGKLGDGTTTQRLTPVQIATDVVSVSAGEDHTLFVKTNSSLWAMGCNDDGQLGDGTTTSRSTPVQVATDVGSVAAGLSHSLFLSAPRPAAPIITTQPTAQTVNAGGLARFSVTATSTVTLNYQWQVSTDGGSTWANLSDGAQYAGATTATLTVDKTTAPMKGYQYRCVIDDGVNPAVISNPSSLTVQSTAAPTITAQPTAQTVNVGGLARFSVTATSTVPLNYQWQVSTDGGSTWANLSDGAQYAGATTATLTVNETTAPMQGYQYRCVINDGVNPAVASNASSLTVQSTAAPTITTQPTAQTVNAGGLARFSVTATSTVTLNYQWQVSTDGGSTWANLSDGAQYAGATTATLTVNETTAPMQGYQYRCVINDGVNPAVASNASSLTVQSTAAPTITTQPTAQTVNAGGLARFSVTATSTVTLNYQWQVSTDGGSTWANLSDGTQYAGASTATLTVNKPTAPMQGYQYRCVINDGVNPAITSNASALTVQSSQFAALSARAPAGTGEQTLILGFVFAGGGKPTLVRGVGPAMAASVSGHLRDPQLHLYSDGTEVANNDNWGGASDLSDVFARTGAGPLEPASKDAALYSPLTGTVYTAHVSGANGTTGVALAEAYDANLADKTKRLTALSVRNQVGVDDAILIAGFVIAGDAPKRVIVRGVGPGISATVSSYLRDPSLHVRQLNVSTGQWTLVDENDNWDSSAETAALFASVGMGRLDSGSKDAALVLTLAPGIYTAEIAGVNRTTGVGVAEIYEAP